MLNIKKKKYAGYILLTVLTTGAPVNELRE